MTVSSAANATVQHFAEASDTIAYEVYMADEQGVRHVILGAGGAIGTPLAIDLLARGIPVRAVSRSGRGPEGAEIVRADLHDPRAVLAAVDEGAIVYLLAGLSYDRRVWRESWPRIMRNVVAACSSKGARLVFLDNVYAYGRVDGWMSEATPIRPSSVKGAIRAEIADFLVNEVDAGRLMALIARSADFYGPHAEKTSTASILVLNRLAAGKRAQVMADAGKLHSYTYTLDAARGLYMLATAEDAYNQAWHLPTARPPLTGREFVELAGRALGVAPRLSVIPGWAIRAASPFSTLMRELAEMLYQNENDYLFDSSKFERRFGITATTYEEGMKATARLVRTEPAASRSASTNSDRVR